MKEQPAPPPSAQPRTLLAQARAEAEAEPEGHETLGAEVYDFLYMAGEAQKIRHLDPPSLTEEMKEAAREVVDVWSPYLSFDDALDMAKKWFARLTIVQQNRVLEALDSANDDDLPDDAHSIADKARRDEQTVHLT